MQHGKVCHGRVALVHGSAHVIILEMAWATMRPANEPLTGLFTGPLTAQFYLLFLYWAAYEPLTIFEIPLSLLGVIKGS